MITDIVEKKEVDLPKNRMVKVSKFYTKIVQLMDNADSKQIYRDARLVDELVINRNRIDKIKEVVPRRNPYREYRKAIEGLNVIYGDILFAIENLEFDNETGKSFAEVLRKNEVEEGFGSLFNSTKTAPAKESQIDDKRLMVFSDAANLAELDARLLGASKKGWSLSNRRILLWCSDGFNESKKVQFGFANFSVHEGWISMKDQLVLSFSTKKLSGNKINKILDKQLNKVNKKRAKENLPKLVSHEPARSPGIIQFWLMSDRNIQVFENSENTAWVCTKG